MEEMNNELELHARISARIFQTLDEISGEGEEGNITTGTARKIIRMVRNFNYSRELLMEDLKSEGISRQEFRKRLDREGRKCIASINRIMEKSGAPAGL